MRGTCDITINTPNFSIRIKKRNTVHARLREMHYVSVTITKRLHQIKKRMAIRDF